MSRGLLIAWRTWQFSLALLINFTVGTKNNGTFFSSHASDSQLGKSALAEKYVLAEASYWSSNCIWQVWSAGWSSLIVSFKGVRTKTKWFHSLFLQATCQEVNLIPTNHNKNSNNNNIFASCQWHMLLLLPKYLRTAAFQLFPLVLFRQCHPFCFYWQNLRVYQTFASWLHLGFLLWKKSSCSSLLWHLQVFFMQRHLEPEFPCDRGVPERSASEGVF